MKRIEPGADARESIRVGKTKLINVHIYLLKSKLQIAKKNKHYKSREMKVHVRNNISNKINALKAKNKFRLYYKIY